MRELQPSPAKRYSTLRAYYKQNPILAVPRRHRALAQRNTPKYCHAEPQHGALRHLCIEIIKVNPPMRLTHPTNTDYQRTGVTAIARLEQPEFSIISMQSEQLNRPIQPEKMSKFL